LVEGLAKNGTAVVVLAEREESNNDKDKSSIIGVEVRRTWRKGSFASLDAFRDVLKSGVEIVHLQHEYFALGGAASIIQAPFLLFLCRLARKKVIVTLHGVIPNSLLDSRFLRMNFVRVSARIARIANRIITKSLVCLAQIVLVHDDKFGQILVKELRADPRKIVVLPFPVYESVDPIPIGVARRKLGLDTDSFVLGYIGFITGYKGVEVLIRSLNLLGEDANQLRLLFAGSPHPRLQKDHLYGSYIRNLYGELDRLGDRVMTIGFVPEEDLVVFFSACDAIVFPYTAGISSSAPLYQALAYRRPCLASNEIASPLPQEYRFVPTPEELANKILYFYRNRGALNNQVPLIAEYARVNSWKKYAESLRSLYEKLLAEGASGT
jgi:glycosyltransferase involved in cell wall biosynthesis